MQQINTLASQIQQDNVQIQQDSTPDAGLQANLQATLQNLSQLADTTVTFAPNGTATVLLGGQTPLVIGTTQYSIQASFADPTPGPNPNAIADAHILNSDGQDITSQISQGSLAGLLTVRNTVLPSLQGDGTQQGALNQLAQSVADSVNQILTAAQTPTGAAGVRFVHLQQCQPGGCRADSGRQSRDHHRHAGARRPGASAGEQRRGARPLQSGRIHQPRVSDQRPVYRAVRGVDGGPGGPAGLGRPE